MFIAEKNITGIEDVPIDLNALEHKTTAFRARSPMARVPILELDDGRYLGETRAICTYLEAMVPEPNLMGRDATERAFIEMTDRRVEFHLLALIATWIRHCHPGLATLEVPQFPEFGQKQSEKLAEVLGWLDEILARQPFIFGENFTIVDITAYCGIEFAKLMKFRPGEAGYRHVQSWRDRIAERPSAAM
jgi:glutathione S-transferase